MRLANWWIPWQVTILDKRDKYYLTIIGLLTMPLLKMRWMTSPNVNQDISYLSSKFCPGQFQVDPQDHMALKLRLSPDSLFCRCPSWNRVGWPVTVWTKIFWVCLSYVGSKSLYRAVACWPSWPSGTQVEVFSWFTCLPMFLEIEFADQSQCELRYFGPFFHISAQKVYPEQFKVDHHDHLVPKLRSSPD